ncbi:hypothetical protein NIES4103_13750 [Nostoc sp. NIES-4103]|nr:hypothetical protein NIES4103_13750 [Nostoc sp. NIES-4103]
MTQDKSSLSIGLLENCCHSLKRGYELWNKGKEENDGWLLKEAIFWVHHGIEISLKRLLVQTNEYLVFSDVDKALTQLSQLRQENKSKSPDIQYGALDLFDQKNSPHSIGFEKLIDRAAIMLKLTELEKNSSLRNKIDRLTNYRNKIAHFSIKLEIVEVATLLAEILDPLLELLEKNIDDADFVSKCIPEIRLNAQPAKDASDKFLFENEQRIIKLIEKFHGQGVEGNLFGLENTGFLLPIVTKTKLINKNHDVGIDIIAETAEKKTLLVQILSSDLLFMGDLPFKITTKYGEDVIKWLVIMKPLSLQRIQELANIGLLVSSLNEINSLERKL